MKKLLPLLCLLLVTGCATPVAVTPQALQSLNGKRLAVAVAERGNTSANTSTKGFMFGPLGIAAGIVDGNNIVKKNNIPDPAIDLAQDLAQKISAHHHMQVINDTPVASATPAYATATANADFILLTHSQNATVQNYLRDFNNYFLHIPIAVYVMDAKTQKDIYSFVCLYKLEYDDADQAPSWDDLFDNGAAGYKDQLLKAKDYCLNEISKQLL